ncbi:Chlorovirus glycoprotein repeat domain-containing protein [Acanthocystis turfacea Chlorella virus MN0810.1]|nr:Chlorovirus glycoprotein repeat domain-containing protein [Acanthocystis turfacea Chlorella virus MN0810.1]
MSTAWFKTELFKYAGINTDARTMNYPGTIVATEFVGNSSVILSNIPPTANLDIYGNVRSGAYANLDHFNVNNALTVAGNIGATVYYGLGNDVTLNGLLIIPSGNVANARVRLGLTADTGTYVIQDDTLTPYLLTSQPPSVPSNWLNFTGTNTVSTVFGRSGAVVAQVGDYQDNQVTLSRNIGPLTTTANNAAQAFRYLNVTKLNEVQGRIEPRIMLGNVDATRGNIDTSNINTSSFLVKGNVIGNTLVTGNIYAPYFIGDTFAPGNVDAANVTVSVAATVNGNADLNGQVNVVGNVSASNFIGNLNLTGNLAAQYFLGNVDAKGNVDAVNMTSNILLVNGNTVIGGEVSAPGADVSVAGGFFFKGNNLVSTGNVSATFFVGNVVSRGNVDVARNLTVKYLYVYGNATLSVPNDTDTFRVIGGGNVYANNFTGNVIVSSNISAQTFFGNVISRGNVDAANIVVGNLRVSSNSVKIGEVVVGGNVTAANFVGNLIVRGNVSAPNFLGNVDSQGNVYTDNLYVGNILSQFCTFEATRLNIAGNLIASPFFIGDYVQSVNANTVGNLFSRFFLGNVRASGNVDASNITANSLFANTTVSVTGQVNVGGNVYGGFLSVGNLSTAGNIVAPYIIGNVDSQGNVDAANMTATSLYVSGNTVVAGQVDVLGNVIANNFSGNVIPRGNITAQYFLGNVSAPGNVDAANISTGSLAVGVDAFFGGQVNVAGNVTSAILSGNVIAPGNVSAEFFQGGIFAPGNIDSANATVDFAGFNGNASILGQVTVAGNVSTLYNMYGNLIATTGTVAFGNLIGNVQAAGNVDAANVTTGLLRVNGPARFIGQVTVLGNVYANNFAGALDSEGNVYAPIFYGNVVSKGNVDAANISTNNLRVDGNVVGLGDFVDVTGNVAAGTLFGDFVQNGNVYGNFFGNLEAKGNVNTSNIVCAAIATYGPVNIGANLLTTANIYSDFLNAPNITVTSNMSARLLIGNLDVLTGNVDGNNMLARGNLIVSGNANIAGHTFVNGNITIRGNIIMPLNGSYVTTRNMPWMWSSSINGSPDNSGTNNIVNATLNTFGTLPGPVYSNVQYGTRLTLASSLQTNSVAWNLTNYFDFSKNFRLRMSMYMDTQTTLPPAAEGVWFTVGGDGISRDDSSATGGVTVMYQTSNNLKTVIRLNGGIINQVPFHTKNTNYQGGWYSVTAEIRNIGVKKYIVLFTGGLYDVAEDGAEITGWNPGGNFLCVGGRTGTTTANTYVNQVTLEYI